MCKIFLGWSGERSKRAAKALRDWIPTVIQAADPWMSEADIDPGSMWDKDLLKTLEEAKIGILCITSDDLESIWMHFEAGMLANSLKDSNYVCPYLLGIEPSDIKGPLSHFQAKKAEKESTKQLLYLINDLTASPIEKSRIDLIFESFWGQLEFDINDVVTKPAESILPPRDSSDILNELLELTRQQSRTLSELIAYKKDDRLKTRAEIIIQTLKEDIFKPETPFSSTVSGFLINPKKDMLEDELMRIIRDQDI
jgi:hypothetical protein